MKAFVDEDNCIGCGNCEIICPTVFRMNDEGRAEVIVETLDDSTLDCAKEAEEQCPAECIVVE